MTATENDTQDVDAGERVVLSDFTGGVAAALVVGVALGVTARVGALALLIAVAAVQALLAVAVLWGFTVPSRKVGLVLAGFAAAGADIAVSVWPHSRLGTLLPVLALAVPVLIVHQLLRGAARVRVLESLGGTAFVVVTEVALPSLLQLRHEFIGSKSAGQVVFAVVLAATAALAVGFLTDMVITVPRFDAGVPRGLLGVVAAALVGGLVGSLAFQNSGEFDGSRGLFAGASIGVLIALFAVGVSFAEAAAPPAVSTFGRRIRPVLAVVIPVALIAPVAFLLCLAIRG